MSGLNYRGHYNDILVEAKASDNKTIIGLLTDDNIARLTEAFSSSNQDLRLRALLLFTDNNSINQIAWRAYEPLAAVSGWSSLLTPPVTATEEVEALQKTSQEVREYAALCYLAACDKEISIDLQDRIWHDFKFYIAEIRRAHNEHDNAADKPAPLVRVLSRLAQAVNQHPDFVTTPWSLVKYAIENKISSIVQTMFDEMFDGLVELDNKKLFYFGLVMLHRDNIEEVINSIEDEIEIGLPELVPEIRITLQGSEIQKALLFRDGFIRELLKKDLAARVKQYIDNHYKDILPIAAITFLIANTLLNDLPKLFTLSAKRFNEINTICQGYTEGPRVLLFEGPTSRPIKPLGSIQEAETATARFTLRHDRGRDDEKASKFYKEIARHFSFSKQKIVFIVVPHMVHTLPYFIESLTHIGGVIAIIPKSAQYVHGAETSLNTIYKSIIRRDINKQILSCEPDKVRVFLQDIFDQFKDCQLMILDHGGYFAPCLDILKEFSSRISGVVEHTWNGDIRYQKELGKLPTPIPIYSIARSYLKAHEDAYVAASIVDTMRAVIFSANGLNQDLTRLQIGIIGYGHMGEAVARYLLKTDVPSGNIMVCDSSPARLASAREIFSLVSPEINSLLEQCDVIIAAASEQILGRAQFSHMRAGTCVICVTSSDDQFESDAKADLTKMSRKAYITTYRHTNGKKIHLACDGKSVNFCIGSTAHPILHAVLASDYVSAFYCATNHRPSLSSTIRSIPEEQFQAIENIYKRIFDGLLSGLETLRRTVSETSYIPGRGLNALLSAPGIVKPVLLSRPTFAELEKRIPSTTAEAKKPIQLR